jgi:hypothetical protein
MAKRIMKACRAREGNTEVVVNSVCLVTCEDSGIVHVCQGQEDKEFAVRSGHCEEGKKCATARSRTHVFSL